LTIHLRFVVASNAKRNREPKSGSLVLRVVVARGMSEILMTWSQELAWLALQLRNPIHQEGEEGITDCALSFLFQLPALSIGAKPMAAPKTLYQTANNKMTANGLSRLNGMPA
jgi:hypothetical protein